MTLLSIELILFLNLINSYISFGKIITVGKMSIQNLPLKISALLIATTCVNYSCGVEVTDSLNFKNWSSEITGSDFYFDDYNIGEEIDHLDGQTIEEAEHQLATRLYQNNARVHFNHHIEKDGRFGKRIIYGGYIISLARAISCNGLANAFKVIAIHSGKHSSPTFSGDTIYAWSKILEKEKINDKVGALKIRTLASKNNSNMNFPDSKELTENIVLDLVYSVLMPIR